MLPNPLCFTPGGDLGTQDLRAMFTDHSGLLGGFPFCFAPLLLLGVSPSSLRPANDLIEHLPERILDPPVRTITPPTVGRRAWSLNLKHEPQVPPRSALLAYAHGVLSIQRLYSKDDVAGSGNHGQPATLRFLSECVGDHHRSTTVRPRSR